MDSWASLLLSALGGGGLVAILKLIVTRRPIEVRGELQVVTAALEHNQTLRADLDRAIDRIVKLESSLSEVRAENVELYRSISKLESENQKLRDRCDHLEQENKRLQA